MQDFHADASVVVSVGTEKSLVHYLSWTLGSSVVYGINVQLLKLFETGED